MGNPLNCLLIRLIALSICRLGTKLTYSYTLIIVPILIDLLKLFVLSTNTAFM